MFLLSEKTKGSRINEPAAQYSSHCAHNTHGSRNKASLPASWNMLLFPNNHKMNCLDKNRISWQADWPVCWDIAGKW